MIFYSGMHQNKQAQNCGLALAELSCTSFQDVEAKSQEEWHSIEDSALPQDLLFWIHGSIKIEL